MHRDGREVGRDEGRAFGPGEADGGVECTPGDRRPGEREQDPADRTGPPAGDMLAAAVDEKTGEQAEDESDRCDDGERHPRLRARIRPAVPNMEAIGSTAGQLSVRGRTDRVKIGPSPVKILHSCDQPHKV
jgi:hypothetical protein